MLRVLIVALVLSTFLDAVDKKEEFVSPPTTLDMMRLMTNYLSEDVSSEMLFDMGVKTNMRVPLKHLRVLFTDLRTKKEMSKKDIADILGSSRQDNSHDLILHTLTAFEIPGVSAEHIIDIFDASALASMRNPPKYVDIEFYDARVGPTYENVGGVSGSVPTKVYQPKNENKKASKNIWSDERIVDYFVANNKRLTLKDEHIFLLPGHGLAKDYKELINITREQFRDLAEENPGFDIKFVDQKEPLFTYAAVALEGEKRRYIVLIHLKTTDIEKAKEIQKLYPKLYNR